MSDENRKPWHRREEETPKAYAYFREYMSVPPAERSIRRAAEAHGKSDRYWEELSAKFDWIERAAAYDEWLAEQADEEMAAQVRMARRELAMKAPSLAWKLAELAEMETDEPNPTILRAIIAALDRAGVSVPKDINVSGGMSLEHMLMDLADEEDEEPEEA